MNAPHTSSPDTPKEAPFIGECIQAARRGVRILFGGNVESHIQEAEEYISLLENTLDKPFFPVALLPRMLEALISLWELEKVGVPLKIVHQLTERHERMLLPLAEKVVSSLGKGAEIGYVSSLDADRAIRIIRRAEQSDADPEKIAALRADVFNTMYTYFLSQAHTAVQNLEAGAVELTEDKVFSLFKIADYFLDEAEKYPTESQEIAALRATASNTMYIYYLSKSEQAVQDLREYVAHRIEGAHPKQEQEDPQTKSSLSETAIYFLNETEKYHSESERLKELMDIFLCMSAAERAVVAVEGLEKHFNSLDESAVSEKAFRYDFLYAHQAHLSEVQAIFSKIENNSFIDISPLEERAENVARLAQESATSLKEPAPLPVKGIDFAFSAEEGFLRYAFGQAANTFVKRLNDATSDEMPDEITSFLNTWARGQPTKSIIPWEYEAYEISDMLCGTLALLYKGGDHERKTAVYLNQKICTAAAEWQFSSGSNIFGQLLSTLTWLAGYYDSNAKTSKLNFDRLLNDTKNTRRHLIIKLFNTKPDFQHRPSIIHCAHCWNELYENVSSPSLELMKDDLKECKVAASVALHNFQEKNNPGLDQPLWGAATYLYQSLYPWTIFKSGNYGALTLDKNTLDDHFQSFCEHLGIDTTVIEENITFNKKMTSSSVDILENIYKKACWRSAEGSTTKYLVE